MTAGPYAIGSIHCPGLSKLSEEAGEVVQVIGKTMGAGGLVEHWDGSDLRLRLVEEIADVMAACSFVIKANGLDALAIAQRRQKKLAIFRRWHDEAQPADRFAAFRAANAVYVPGRKQFIRNAAMFSQKTCPHEWCSLCGKHVSQHFTDGRPTYFCNQDVDP
jgi:NTP pyrophosphatase (non-canonical NTP hydrolase)